MAGAHVFGVGADPLGKPCPDAVSALGKVELFGTAALAAHAAKVDAAGARAAQAALDQHGSDAGAPQGQRGAGADQTCADDGDVGMQ
ncbi:hypothetical protein D3C78_1467710 [compost metagenome]